ncbi:hypothetical protein R1flu_006850 [Riccia fluitans]|uniref:Uncharacterized protein n=1 Tax=Riccia fluitans TaxID=41844 RepID=A0ABD1YX65_9MARC
MPIRNILQEVLIEIEAVAWRFNPDQFAAWLENRNKLLSWIQQTDSATSLAATTESSQQELITCEFCIPDAAITADVNMPSSTEAVVPPMAQNNQNSQDVSASGMELINARPTPLQEFPLIATSYRSHPGIPAFGTNWVNENGTSEMILDWNRPPARIPPNSSLSLQDPQNLQFSEPVNQADGRILLAHDANFRNVFVVEDPVVSPSCLHCYRYG